MRVRFVADHLLPIGPGMARDFRAGWAGDLPADLAEAAIAAGVAEADEGDDAPADDEDGA